MSVHTSTDGHKQGFATIFERNRSAQMGVPWRFFAPLVLVYILRNGLDTSDPQNIVWMRAFFATCKGGVMILYAYIFMKLSSR